MKPGVRDILGKVSLSTAIAAIAVPVGLFIYLSVRVPDAGDSAELVPIFYAVLIGIPAIMIGIIARKSRFGKAGLIVGAIAVAIAIAVYAVIFYYVFYVGPSWA
jgi:ABC-type phosphate transport system permease subunit